MRLAQPVVREWGYIDVRDDGSKDCISRAAADSLMATAKASNLGGLDGESILINGHRRLRAQQIVGVIASPLASLEILPKIDDGEESEGQARQRLVHMLSKVINLPIADGVLTQLDWQNQSLLEILITLFCDRLADLVRRGLPRRYVPREDDLAALRGRLDVRRQFTTLAASPWTVACQFDDLDIDTPLNQVMRAAVSKLRGIARSPANQRKLAELAFAFAEVSDVPVASLAWQKIVLDRTNVAWTSTLGLARLLFGERFQTTSLGGGRGFSLLFEMNTLFEEYIGLTLRRALRDSDYSVTLQGPRSHVLLGEGEIRRFATKPDIVISRGKKHELVIDTKWKRLKGLIDDPKRGVGQADVYQMMAYAHVYDCRRLLLLYPHHGALGDKPGLVAPFAVAGQADTRLSVATVSLSNLRQVANDLVLLVAQKLSLDPTELRRASA